MQAFIYCRVSSEEQANDNHYFPENQEMRGRDYCKSKGRRVVGGKDANRDGFLRSLSASLYNIPRHEVPIVLNVEDMDTLSEAPFAMKKVCFWEAEL